MKKVRVIVGIVIVMAVIALPLASTLFSNSAKEAEIIPIDPKSVTLY